MDLFVIYKTTNNDIIGYATTEQDAIKLTTNSRFFEKDPIAFMKAEQYEELIGLRAKESKDDEQCCGKFARIEGIVAEAIYDFACSRKPYLNNINIEYLKFVNYPEIDKDFKFKVPKFMEFDELESNDNLYITTHFIIWIEEIVELTLDLKENYLNEIIKPEYVKLDRIKDFKQAFNKMMQVKYSKDYSDDMWKARSE